MKILCNENSVFVRATVLGEALIELGYHDATVATALNGEFVPKSARNNTLIREGDRVDVVAPMQGG